MADDGGKPDVAGEGGEGAQRKRTCLICGRPAVVRYRPFCSRRCADIDLGRWFKGDYRVAAVEPPDGEDADAIEAARGEDRPEED